jgi:hypothetical protein
MLELGGAIIKDPENRNLFDKSILALIGSFV